MQYLGLTSNATTVNKLSVNQNYAGFNLNYKELTVDFSYNETTKGVFDGAPSINRGNKLSTYATNLFFDYKKELSTHVAIDASIAYFVNSHTLNYELFRKYYYEVDYQKTEAFQSYIRMNLKLNKNASIQFGLSSRTVISILQLSDFAYYGLNYGDGEAGLPDGEHYSTIGGYLQINYLPFTWLTINAGTRLEYLQSYTMYYARGIITEDSTDNRLPTVIENRKVIEAQYQPDNNGITYSPRLAFIAKLSTNQYLKILFSLGQKQPSFSENYRQLPQNRPSLHKTEIKTSELNYYAYLYKKLILSSSIYFSDLTNIINATNVYNSTSSEWEIYSTNSGRISTLGTELKLTFKPSMNFTLNGGVSYQQSKSGKSGYENIEVAYSPNLLANANIVVNLPKNTIATLLGHYVGSMQTEWVTETLPEDGARLGDESNAYFLLDLNVRKNNIFKTKFFADIKINNLLNTIYRYPITASNAWIDKGVLGDALSWHFTIGARF
jgi:hypothetical protein